MVGGKISTFLKTVPILYVPVNPITTLDEKGFNYSLVFFRDSVGGLDARLQVYMATPDYKKANPTFNVNNFSGYFFQIHLNGKVDKVFAIENGKFAAKVSFAANSRFNPNQATTRCFCCECWHNAGSGVVHNVRCFLCALGEAIGNTVSAVVTNISDSNNNNVNANKPEGFLHLNFIIFLVVCYLLLHLQVYIFSYTKFNSLEIWLIFTRI